MVIKINSDECIYSIIRKQANGKRLIFYGAGNYGIMTQKYLQSKFNVEIDGFAISTGQKMVKLDKPIRYINTIEKDVMLVITISEQKQKPLIEIAEKEGFTEIYVVLNEFVRYIKSKLVQDRLLPHVKLSFEVHVVEHCNLNCKGCYHFSPVAKKEFLSIKEYEKDLKRLSQLCKSNVFGITLLGGEPLLHPKIIEFMQITRREFPECRLKLLTNGILLLQMDVDFWNACVDLNVLLCCTKYPVNINYNQIEETARKYGKEITYHNDVGAGEKTLIKYPFDLSGMQDIEQNYKNCTRSNLCITLKHGKIYTCPMAAHMHLANDYFHLGLELSDKDYINIYEAKSMEEITTFLVHPIPFCKYCDLHKKPEQMLWEQSKKKKEEWF